MYDICMMILAYMYDYMYDNINIIIFYLKSVISQDTF